MASYGFIAKIGADTSGLNDAVPKLREIDNEAKKLKSELRSVDGALKLNPESAVLAAQKMELLDQAAKKAAEKLAVLKSKQNEMTQAYQRGDIGAEQYREYERAVESAAGRVNELRANLVALQGPAADATTTFERGRDVVKQYDDAISDLNSAASKVGNDIKGIATAATAAATAIGAASLGALKESTEMGMSFEAAMSKVGAISGASAEDMALLEKAAKEAGASTSRSATESAQALSYMSLAGWKTEEMLTGLMPILRASEAGEMDLARCSDLVTDSMSAMSISVNDLAHYLDVVAKAQSNSNTSMEQLLEAFVVCGGTASNLGINVEELSTILGVMANRGIKGSEAGTALNSVLVNMLGTTKRTAEAMETLGLSMFDSEGNTKNMTEVLHEMGDALTTCDDKQKMALESMLGGKTQMDALMAIINGVTGEYDDLAEALNNADGALQSTAKTMQENLRGQITAMNSALEGLGINIYGKFEEPFKSAVSVITEEITKLSESVDNGRLGESLSRLAGSLSELIKRASEYAANKGIPKLIEGLDWLSRNGDTVISVIKSMGAAWAAWKLVNMATHVMELVKAIQAFKVAQEAATEAQIAANAAAMANVYAVVAAAVVALTTAIVNYAIAQGEARIAQEKADRELSESTKAIIEQRKALEETNREINKNCSETEERLIKTHELWEELKLLVDEEGNVADKEEEVRKLTSEINTLAGTNIEITNGQVQGYKDLKDSLDDYLESKMLEAQLSYLTPLYGEALIEMDKISAKYEEANAIWNQALYDSDVKLKAAAELRKQGLETEAQNLEKEAENIRQSKVEWETAAGEYKAQIAIYQETIDKYNELEKQKKTITPPTPETEKALGVGEEIVEAIAEGAENAGEEASDAVAETVEKTYDEATKKIVEGAYQSAIDAGKSMGEASADAITKALNADLKDSDLKSVVKGYFDDLKIYAQKNELGDEWLYTEMQKMVDILPEGTDLYRQYVKEVLDGQDKLKKAKNTENTDNAKSEFDTLFAEYEAELISRETFNKRYLELTEEWAEKKVDIHEYADKKIKEHDEKTQKELWTAWEKESKEITDKIAKNYESVTKAYEDARAEYLKNTQIIDKKVTDINGKDRYILTDFKKQTAELKKYMDDLEKLKKTGISEDLLSSIMEMDYNSGERQGYISELLRMSESDLQKYYKDVDNYYSLVNQEAQKKVEDKLREADEAAAEGIMQIWESRPDIAYEKGAEEATAYINGLIDTMREADSLRLKGPDFKSTITEVSGKSSGASAGAAMPKDIIINLDGREVIKISMDKYINDINYSGGMIGG